MNKKPKKYQPPYRPDHYEEDGCDSCNRSRAYTPSFWKCPDCGELWRVICDNIAWCGWIKSRGLWRPITKFMTRRSND